MVRVPTPTLVLSTSLIAGGEPRGLLELPAALSHPLRCPPEFEEVLFIDFTRKNPVNLWIDNLCLEKYDGAFNRIFSSRTFPGQSCIESDESAASKVLNWVCHLFFRISSLKKWLA